MDFEARQQISSLRIVYECVISVTFWREKTSKKDFRFVFRFVSSPPSRPFSPTGSPSAYYPFVCSVVAVCFCLVPGSMNARQNDPPEPLAASALLKETPSAVVKDRHASDTKIDRLLTL